MIKFANRTIVCCSSCFITLCLLQSCGNVADYRNGDKQDTTYRGNDITTQQQGAYKYSDFNAYYGSGAYNGSNGDNGNGSYNSGIPPYIVVDPSALDRTDDNKVIYVPIVVPRKFQEVR